MTEKIKLPLKKLRTDGGTQTRAGNNQEAIDEYAAAMREGTEFPPIVVFHDKKARSYWIADGFHRYYAAKEAGLKEILCEVHVGDQRDAILHACAANGYHGIRRTPEDKRKAIAKLLRDPEWAQWSDREIARHCVVGHKLVAKVRAELAESTGAGSSSAIRKSADGKTRDTSKIAESNRQRAADKKPTPRVVLDAPEPLGTEPEPEFSIDEEIAEEAEATGDDALLDAEGNPIPEDQEEIWETLQEEAAFLDGLVRQLFRRWQNFEARVGELQSTYGPAHLPTREIVSINRELQEKLRHIAWRFRQLAPVLVCDGCGGKGGGAVGKACCELGWHGQASAKQRREKKERAEAAGRDLDETRVA